MPAWSTMVEHQSLPWSSPSLVQELKVLPCQVKGNTQGFPAAGPDTVLQVRLKSAAAVVVEVEAVVVVVVVVVEVDTVVVVEVETVVVVEVVVVVVVVVVAPGQVDEQTDSLPRMWVPFSWVLVLHHGEERRSVETQEL